MFDLHSYLKERAQLIERALKQSVSEPTARRRACSRRCAIAARGRQALRPMLALASCEAVGGKVDDAMGLACAVEMIHTYSLIHDDLPCMDDDDLRHGRPTNHKVYGEAIATLAGDALVTDAFAVLAHSAGEGASRSWCSKLSRSFPTAAGSGGMVAGQVIDLLGEGRSMNLEELEYLHSKKTGALFLAGVRRRRAPRWRERVADRVARRIRARAGAGFQVVDDLLDVEASTEQMGKRTKRTASAARPPIRRCLGIERSSDFARELETRAQRALHGFDHRAEPLRHIATFVVERKQ